MLLVSSGKKLYAVWSDQIMYLTSDSGYSVLQCGDGRRFVSSKGLLDLAEQLPDGMFVPVNRSVVVNLRYINCVENGTINVVTMNNGEEFQISRRRKSDFYNHMVRI